MAKLTDSQRAVVLSNHPDILVVAGPGSGKTHTMVQRINRLLEQGRHSEQMVVITFTNAGAKELRHRLDNPVCLHDTNGDGNCGRQTCRACSPRNFGKLKFGYLGTLHGFALRELQRWGKPLGYTEAITVLDEKQAEDLLGHVMRQTGYKGAVKKLLTTMERREIERPRTPEEITTLAYRRELRGQSAVDFATILWDFAELLNTRTDAQPTTPYHCSSSWEHLIVDEYQDSAPIDAEIYNGMSVLNRCFVGDPDQAIYGFRGATIENILELADQEGTEVHYLETNFRCGPEICRVANHLIQHNLNRPQKRTLPIRHRESQVLVLDVEGNEDEEARRVLQDVAVAIQAGTDPMEIAVLSRYNAIANSFAALAAGLGIPVRKKATVDLPHDFQKMRAGLGFLYAPNKEVAVWNWLRHAYGDEQAQAFRRGAALAQKPLWWSCPDSAGIGSVHAGNVSTCLARLGISRESIAVVDAKLALMQEPTLLELAYELANDGVREEEGTGVTFTTLHGAKGREWQRVYLVACEQEIIPGSKTRDQEEERRLMYVGVTRAKDVLIMSYARQRRQTWGRKDHAPANASKFLGEMA